MKKQEPIEIFMPPNILKAKAGKSVGFDASAVKRAEDALENLKTEFADWINADVQMLAEARDAYAVSPVAEMRADLYRASHDLRGQARTFEFPLVEVVATSLCRMLDHPSPPPLSLIDAHVGAIRIIVRDKIRDRTNLMATTLAKELDARVTEFIAAA